VHALVEIFVVVVVVAMGVATVAFGVTFRHLRHAIRVVPSRPTSVPPLWFVHPCRPAQLHRRLRRVCRSVIAAVGLPTRSLHPSRRHRRSSPLTRVGAEVMDRAMAIDGRLVAAHRLSSPWRRSVLEELSAEVRAVEAAAVRVGRLDSIWREHQRAGAPSGPVGEPSLEIRLDAMEAAMADLHVKPPLG